MLDSELKFTGFLAFWCLTVCPQKLQKQLLLSNHPWVNVVNNHPWVVVVGARTTLQTVAWSLSVINALKQPRSMCSDADCGALVVWQRERASLNVLVQKWAEQLDKC